MKYCHNCGYQIDDEEYEAIKKSSGIADAKFEDTTSTEKPDSKAYTGEPALTEKRKVPPGAKVKSKLPKSTTCKVCNVKSDELCYFCDYAICSTHSVNMQIIADKSELGNVIQSCPECADKRNGRQPTNEEAEDIGFFFNIKPYHEWKIVKD
jgi:hypothetical protein